jgi:hypothetical protein
MAPWPTLRQADTIVLSAGQGGYEAAARLANVWQRAVYAPPEHAVGADATVHDTRMFHRFDPRPPRRTRSANSRPTPTACIWPAIRPAGSTSTATSANCSAPARARRRSHSATTPRSPPSTGPKPPGAPQEPLTPEAQRAADEQLVRDEQRALRNWNSGASAPFGWTARSARSATASPRCRSRSACSNDEFASGRLPPAVARAAIQNVLKTREVLEQHEVGFDLQGIFTRSGDFLVCDPGPILNTYAAHTLSLSRLFEIEKGIHRWIEQHGVDALDSALDPTRDLRRRWPTMRSCRSRR